MQTMATQVGGFQAILERKGVELGHQLRNRDDIVIETSADQMDEIQYASERDLAITKRGPGFRPAARGSSRIAPRSGRHLWDLHRLRIADQSETPRCRAVGVALYPLPGVCRPAQSRDRRLVARRQPRQSTFQTGHPAARRGHRPRRASDRRSPQPWSIAGASRILTPPGTAGLRRQGCVAGGGRLRSRRRRG